MPAKKKARAESGVKVTESVNSEPEPRSGKVEAKQREPEIAPSGTRPSPEGAISIALREQTFALRGLEASKVPAAAVDVSALIQECWIGRKSASAMLFRARNLQLAKLLEHLTPFIFQSPCPSPILLEHMKETLVATWADDPQLVNDTIKSFSPSNASTFWSAIEICAIFLKNIWSEPHSDDWFDQGDAAAEENSAQCPFDAVVPSTSRNWSTLTGNGQPPNRNQEGRQLAGKCNPAPSCRSSIRREISRPLALFAFVIGGIGSVDAEQLCLSE